MNIASIDQIPIPESALAELEEFGNFVYHKTRSSSQEERILRCQDQDVIITDVSSKIDKALLEKNPTIRLIAHCATGVDNIDMDECEKRGIEVKNVKNYCDATLAEYVFAMIINLTRNVAGADKYVENEHWDYSKFRGVELFGKRMGVIGTGGNGAAVIKIAQGYGMEVLALTKHPSAEKAEQLGITSFVNLQTLLSVSDFISIHVPLVEDTYHMLGEGEFDLIKEGAYLINTARGGVVESNALLDSIKSGRLAGAALDVLEEDEPLDFTKISDVSRQLIAQPHVIVTPHIAFYSNESVRRLSKATIKNIKTFLASTEL